MKLFKKILSSVFLYEIYRIFYLKNKVQQPNIPKELIWFGKVINKGALGKYFESIGAVGFLIINGMKFMVFHINQSADVFSFLKH